MKATTKATGTKVATSTAVVPVALSDQSKKYLTRVYDALGKSVQGFISAGKVLAEAKGKLKAEQWKLLQEQPGLSPSMCTRLMAVAESTRLVAHVQKLPPSLSTLYETTKLDDKLFDRAVSTGVLRPNTERKEIENFRSNTVGAATSVRSASGRKRGAASDNGRATTPPSAPVAADASAKAALSAHDMRMREVVAAIGVLRAAILGAERKSATSVRIDVVEIAAFMGDATDISAIRATGQYLDKLASALEARRAVAAKDVTPATASAQASPRTATTPATKVRKTSAASAGVAA